MFKRFAGIFLTGLVIKLMDDFLDQDLDRLKGEENFSRIIGRGILPYSLVIIILALYFNFNESVSYFAASYFLGMAYDDRERLPSRLFGWQEGLIVLGISILLTSLKDTLSALILILLIQLFDDYVDYRRDNLFLGRNLINTLGIVNSILLTLILFFLVIKFFPLKLVFFSLASFILYVIFWLGKKYQIAG